MAQVATRLKKDLLDDIKLIEREEGADRAAVLRKLITLGLRHWKTDYALKLYQERRVTAWRAAEIAGMTLYEFLDLLKERRVPAQYTIEDLREDLKMIASGSR